MPIQSNGPLTGILTSGGLALMHMIHMMNTCTHHLSTHSSKNTVLSVATFSWLQNVQQRVNHDVPLIFFAVSELAL